MIILTRFGSQGASSRMRFYQYLPFLTKANLRFATSPLVEDAELLSKYQRGRYSFFDLVRMYWFRLLVLLKLRSFELVWIEKEALPWAPALVERWLLRRVPYVMDFDDAVFHNYDLHPSRLVRSFFGRRVDHLMAGARLVIAGNRYLANRALAAGAQWVEVMPTVVDLNRYSAKCTYVKPSKLFIVWIGSPSTVQYLLELGSPLEALSKLQSFRLRVIGGGPISIPGVDVEVVQWSAETEAAAISECDVGIMPLFDTPWEQGKCAYKLIQYMACGLPTVASPVGANCDVVLEGQTGFFADTASAWMQKLGLLLSDAGLRQRMGQAGRARVEANYCLEKMAPRLVRLLSEASVC